MQKKIFNHSITVSEINAILRFMQKFKIATEKKGGKTSFGKKCDKSLHIPCRPKISLKLLV